MRRYGPLFSQYVQRHACGGTQRPSTCIPATLAGVASSAVLLGMQTCEAVSPGTWDAYIHHHGAAAGHQGACGCSESP